MSDLNAEVILKTQKSLEKYIKKPVLSEKLLNKPPFRFLHDIIISVMRETGFLKGLYNEVELQSENVKDREAKVFFLNKLITAVKTLSGEDLKVRATKIIAGLDAEDTNLLLQALAACIDKKIDSKDYVTQLKNKDKSKKKDVDKVKKSTTKTLGKINSDREKIKTDEKPKRIKEKDETKGVNKLSDRNKMKESIKSKEKREKSRDTEQKSKVRVKETGKKNVERINSPQEKINTVEENDDVKIESSSPKENVISPKNLTPREDIAKPVTKIEEIKNEQIIQDNENVIKSAYKERPKSARPRSGEIKLLRGITEKETLNETQLIKNLNVEQINEVIKSNNVITPSQPKESTYNRPKSSLRPPSVRPSSARPGAPRLRSDSALPLKELVQVGKINVIVENFDATDSKDEEETVVMQTVTEDVQDNIMLEKSLDIPADKGHLVEQILEQIQDAEQLEEHVKGTIDWEQENSRGRDATTKEINQLRASIQSLTRTANPLGKLMSYLHEDVEAMHAELDSWTNMNRQYVLEIKKQKRINSSTNEPSLNQLKDLNEQIKKQKEDISMVKFNILRNEEKIRDLILKQLIV